MAFTGNESMFTQNGITTFTYLEAVNTWDVSLLVRFSALTANVTVATWRQLASINRSNQDASNMSASNPQAQKRSYSFFSKLKMPQLHRL